MSLFSMSSSDRRTKPPSWVWLALLVVCAACSQALVFGRYPAVWQPDTETYVLAARDLASGDFSAGLGRRTPGYPLLILLTGECPPSIVVAQMVFNGTIALAIFAITLRMTNRRSLAFVAGISFVVNLQQLFQEFSLMTETLSAWSVATTILVLLEVLRRLFRGERIGWTAVLLGLLAGFAILVRPQFIFFLPVLPLLVLYAGRSPRWPSPRSWGGAVLVFAAAGTLVFGWAAMMQAKLGTFTLSSQSGFGMVNHAIDSIELVSDRYAPVRAVLLKTREERIAEVGHSRNAIWYAWPDIQRVTGWTLPQASQQLQSMCVELFLAHPGTYALSVAHAWADFWTVPILWSPELIRSAGLRSSLEAVWWVEHWMLRLANLAFVLLALAAAVSKRIRRALGWDIALTAITLTVLMSSLIQALFDQGASSRYAIPTQALVVVVLLVCGDRIGRPDRGGRKGAIDETTADSTE